MTAPQQMAAARAERAGGPEVLAPQQLPVPEPGPGQLLVRTEAVGVNFIETYQRAGVYPVDFPFVPGAEATGTVVARGEGAEGAEPGERVLTLQGTATYAEYFLVPAEAAVRVPEGISAQTAAALPLQGVTAHYLTRSTYPVTAQDTVLLHAGAGGVGGLALQILRRLGATTITTVSTPEKAEIARGHGADHVIGYEGFREQVLELTAGRGVDVVYDSVGRETFEQSLRCLRPRGTAVLFGGASGQVPPFDLQQLNALGSLYVTRPSVGAYVQTREELQWRLQELFDGIAAGELQVSVDQVFPLDQAARAHQYLEDRRTRGKVLLVP